MGTNSSSAACSFCLWSRCLKKSSASAKFYLSRMLPEPHISDLLTWCWGEYMGIWRFLVLHCSNVSSNTLPCLHKTDSWDWILKSFCPMLSCFPYLFFWTDGSSLGFVLGWKKTVFGIVLELRPCFQGFWSLPYRCYNYLRVLHSILGVAHIFLGCFYLYFKSALVSSLPLTASMIGGVRVLPHQSTSLASWWFWCSFDILSLCHAWNGDLVVQINSKTSIFPQISAFYSFNCMLMIRSIKALVIWAV